MALARLVQAGQVLLQTSTDHQCLRTTFGPASLIAIVKYVPLLFNIATEICAAAEQHEMIDLDLQGMLAKDVIARRLKRGCSNTPLTNRYGRRGDSAGLASARAPD